jgi:hypothetical protein
MGSMERMLAHAPSLLNRAKEGAFPAAMRGSRICQSAASIPTRTTFTRSFDGGGFRLCGAPSPGIRRKVRALI